jgi:Domain of unknown function (DUF222)
MTFLLNLSVLSARIEHMFDMLTETGDRLAALLDTFDPERVSGPAARELWGAFDRIERLAAAGKTLLARRVAATHPRTGSPQRTAADELDRRAGSSTKAARDAVETSTRLTELPEVDAAMRRGELSPAQAEVISGAAAANPQAERRLLDLAKRASLPELRDECLRVKAGADPDPEATHRRIHQSRYLRRYTDGEGGWNLHARGTAEQGAAFNTVIDPIIEQIFGAARREGRHEPPEAYAFDALITMSERAAGHDSVQTPSEPAEVTKSTGADTPDTADSASSEPARITDNAADAPHTSEGEGHRGADLDLAPADPTSDAAKSDDLGASGLSARAGVLLPRGGSPEPRPRPKPNPRYLALLRVDVEALCRGALQGQELCEITGVGPIPVSVARELLGDAIVKLIITRGVDVLNVTHLGRGPTAAQRAALLWMNPACSVEGCHRNRVEFDHREPWVQTRHTRLDELDPLCEFHHDLKTRLGYALAPGTGKRPMVSRDDLRHPMHQKAAPDIRPTDASPPTGRSSPPGACASSPPPRSTPPSTGPGPGSPGTGPPETGSPGTGPPETGSPGAMPPEAPTLGSATSRSGTRRRTTVGRAQPVQQVLDVLADAL